MFELLDQLDTEYTPINNLGHWIKKDEPQILALTAFLQKLQTDFSNLNHRYQALIANKDTTNPTSPTPPIPPKINKPPAHKEGDPEIVEFEGRTWKWCGKCFGGCWNRTHITEEHQPGKGRSKNRRPPPTSETITNETPTTPQANIATPTYSDANIATTSDYDMDFM
jgi:hypothetical protein